MMDNIKTQGSFACVSLSSLRVWSEVNPHQRYKYAEVVPPVLHPSFLSNIHCRLLPRTFSNATGVRLYA
ncbi:hypothetical protein ARMGADRAFT_453714 [Armillaria gallica]|uniref:Uncharacterized protein n=1 Tax=Armillaria gallica TaxID=47427 RepID=A0A2H3D8I8_ARMGA|nr:hypothetical protein ARMGADRAFT_453714 [Armillaria gallica]